MIYKNTGVVVDFSSGYPETVGRHWIYCNRNERRITEFKNLYSSNGINWYAIGFESCVSEDIGKDDAIEKCSLWELFKCKKVFDDVGFVSFCHGFENIFDILDNIEDKSAILEGLLR